MSISEIELTIRMIILPWHKGTKVCFPTLDYGALSHEGKKVSQKQHENKYEDEQDYRNFANV